ncbi:MAG: YceI family protein [Pedobacter sp.]|nr:MAG: YceI family protein [Pedobacter sp.]
MKATSSVQYFWTILKISAIIFMLSPKVIMAQNTYKIASEKSNVVKVLGSSNVHDWTMVAKDVEGTGVFKFNNSNDLVDLLSLKFTVVAKSLKSEKTSMDERTYKSLKADQFPKISYNLNVATVTTLQPNKYAIQATGTLTIAGKTQNISMKVMATVNADRTISIHGSEKLKLTDYGIEPPSFMLGAMKVGNDLVIQFDLNYNK